MDGCLADAAESTSREIHEALTDWLGSLPSQALLERWASQLVAGCDDTLLLAQVSARLKAPHLAHHAVPLMEKAIRIDGETPTLLTLLHAVHLASGDLEGTEELGAKLESLPTIDDLQGKIDEYLRLSNQVGAHQRSAGIIPISKRPLVSRAVQLENELNAYWLSRPAREHTQHCRDHRFVTGGSLLWVSMMRDAKDYALAVDRLEAVFADWDLLHLRFRSTRATVEALVNNGVGACLDSPVDAHLEVGRAIMEQVQERLPPPDLISIHYGFACVYARLGQAELALEQVRLAREGGEDVTMMQQDSDMKSLRHDPRFLELTEG